MVFADARSCSSPSAHPPQEDGSADLSYVLGVAEQVAKAAEHDIALVLKSTVPVGTNEKGSGSGGSLRQAQDQRRQ